MQQKTHTHIHIHSSSEKDSVLCALSNLYFFFKFKCHELYKHYERGENKEDECLPTQTHQSALSVPAGMILATIRHGDVLPQFVCG